jgi:hypothetical protein
MGERVVKVWAWIAAAHDGDAPVSIAALCRAAVLRLGVDGASVTAVSGPVAREPVCASDQVSARLEEFQFTMGEGPGADDPRLGSPMLIPELDSVAARWPGFVPTAVAAGARAMFSFPLQAGAIQVGVLSLYRARPGLLGRRIWPMRWCSPISRCSCCWMLLPGSPGPRATSPWMACLGARADVHQATGMISVQLGVSLEEAFVRLRAHAFASGAALGDVAGEVVRRRLRFGAGAAPGSGG